MDLLKKLSLNDNGPTSSSVPAHAHGQAILEKLGDALREEHPVSAAPSAHLAPKESHENNQSVLAGHTSTLVASGLDKLSNTFSGYSSPQPNISASTPRKDEHLLDKITNALTNHSSSATPPPAPKHEGLLGKLGEAVAHVTKDNTPAKPQTLGDKINNVLGGGAKGEQNEDLVDKAIDFVQEHVLGQGQQKNETALEQLKDNQIADAIRQGFKQTTGHELHSVPLHGRKENH